MSLFSRILGWFKPKPIVISVDEKYETLPKQHHVKLDGVNAYVFDSRESRRRVTITGRNSAHWIWNEGDSLVFVMGGLTTRYKIEKMVRPGGDVYFAHCVFDPRPSRAQRI